MVFRLGSYSREHCKGNSCLLRVEQQSSGHLSICAAFREHFLSRLRMGDSLLLGPTVKEGPFSKVGEEMVLLS